MTRALCIALLVLGACKKEEPVDTGTYDPAADPDEDGLSNLEEDALGTDNRNPDTDGDGFKDGKEVNSNTDPLDADDHPYQGGWEIGRCRDAIHATGDSVGDISEDFVVTDSYGDQIQLYAFCDRVVLVTSLNTEPPQAMDDATDELIALWEAYERHGLMVLALIGPREGVEPTMEQIQDWRDFQGLMFPIAIDPGWEVSHRLTGGPDPLVPTSSIFAAGAEIAVLDQPLDENEVVANLDRL